MYSASSMPDRMSPPVVGFPLFTYRGKPGATVEVKSASATETRASPPGAFSTIDRTWSNLLLYLQHSCIHLVDMHMATRPQRGQLLCEDAQTNNEFLFGKRCLIRSRIGEKNSSLNAGKVYPEHDTMVLKVVQDHILVAKLTFLA